MKSQIYQKEIEKFSHSDLIHESTKLREEMKKAKEKLQYCNILLVHLDPFSRDSNVLFKIELLLLEIIEHSQLILLNKSKLMQIFEEAQQRKLNNN